jgi:hypothetical protein
MISGFNEKIYPDQSDINKYLMISGTKVSQIHCYLYFDKCTIIAVMMFTKLLVRTFASIGSVLNRFIPLRRRLVKRPRHDKPKTRTAGAITPAFWRIIRAGAH